MKYIDSINLINLAIENDLIISIDEDILVYRKASDTKPEGWYIDSKEQIAHELMNDKKGQETIINSLKQIGVEFKKFDFDSLNRLSDIFKEGSKQNE